MFFEGLAYVDKEKGRMVKGRRRCLRLIKSTKECVRVLLCDVLPIFSGII